MTIIFDLINNRRLNKLHCVCFVAFNIQHDLDVAFGDLRSNQVKGYPLEVKALALGHYDVKAKKALAFALQMHF